MERRSLALPFAEEGRAEIDLAPLVQTYSPLLFRVAHSVLRSRDQAEDVVQDVFVRLVQHRQSLNAVRDVRVWLIRIAWNLALDRRRRIRPGQMDAEFALNLVARDLPADVALGQAQHIEAVLLALEQLPHAERHVLLLAALEDLGTAEIAQVLDRSESAVRALLSRARARLRKRLEPKGASR